MVGRNRYIAAIGNFDGVHLGHQFLLKETSAFASQHDAKLGVVLFEPHPRRFFQPDAPPFLLTSSPARDSILRSHGVNEIFTLTFDAELASMTPEQFVNDVLVGRFLLAGVMAGADFRFGAKRAGDGAALKALGEQAGMKVKLVELLDDSDGEGKYGSSAIREAIRDGAMDEAREMLGRPWSVTRSVEEGRKVGRTIGFPTANMTLGSLVEPRNGVYATRAVVNGKVYGAVSNFGRRPTVGSDAPLLETYLFDFEGDLYGQEIQISFHAFLRDEKKFDGLDALKAQIAEDCLMARELLG
ncbi:bifunctional riboflavin kinase/FAD synthetase [Hyphococcus flavus]|uniref:Riboflavin biosynthesis protein n=1 Tax=Hyphococcus flavus TaxID=1866326 RepID=A0AAE9ZK07_9PROT|nr:bifunctional riboflavin kinase/FAD synthetase [Hyphococcus flavus]WDI32556.1 bifunctional riboflavin kinase/FAD synthetase [Hyphococcus flavus]